MVWLGGSFEPLVLVEACCHQITGRTGGLDASMEAFGRVFGATLSKRGKEDLVIDPGSLVLQSLKDGRSGSRISAFLWGSGASSGQTVFVGLFGLVVGREPDSELGVSKCSDP